jgi:putative CocE/NonD family hydrolase
MNPLSRLPRLAAMITDRALGLDPVAVRVRTSRDLPVPMPDGVTLLGDHYRPADHDRPLPVVLIRSPYGRAGFAGLLFAAPLARQGFQVFIQSIRGTFGSGGQFRPFMSEQQDGLATVAWLREQPWCDGRIAMTGGSYLGHTQWAIAPYADPPLESVSLNITSARMTDAFYDHGAPGIQNALNWSALLGNQERGGLPIILPNPRQTFRIRRALRKLPLQAADVEVAGAPVAFWRDFVDHAAPGDEFWFGAEYHGPNDGINHDAANHDDADLTRLPPVSMTTGWWDLFLPGQLRDYAAIRAAGVEARITIGPWLHADPGELIAGTQQDVAWLDHHLNGGPKPEGAPVRVYLQQADRWLDLEQWPPPASSVIDYHLRAGGGLDPAPEPAGDRAATQDRFRYNPADPTPTVGGPLLQPPGRQADNSGVEARLDVLTYTGSPLPADQDVVGPVTARIYVRTELEYADLFVRVCDVDEKGVSRNIVDGIRRLHPKTVPANDVTIGNDGVLAVDVELYPTAYRLRAGHRIRVQVSGGAFPRFARNLGTGEPFGASTRMQPCRFEIFRDAEHPSHVRLPLA